jgi:hypothetical protein
MSHVHVKINLSFGIDSWNRCLSVHKRLQIRAMVVAPARQAGNRFPGLFKRFTNTGSGVGKSLPRILHPAAPPMIYFSLR